MIELMNDYSTGCFKQAVDNVDMVFSMKRDDEQARYETECAQLQQAPRTLPRAPPTEGQTQYVAFATTANTIRPSSATAKQRIRDLTSQVQVTCERLGARSLAHCPISLADPWACVSVCCPREGTLLQSVGRQHRWYEAADQHLLDAQDDPHSASGQLPRPERVRALASWAAQRPSWLPRTQALQGQ